MTSSFDHVPSREPDRLLTFSTRTYREHVYMLSAFEQALKVLHDKGFAAHQNQWMPKVKESWDRLIQSYQQLAQRDRKPIDYSGNEVQAAYLYAYAMPRAYFTHEMLRRHRQATGAPLFPAGAIEIVSVGGGPASELVGLLEYLGDAAHGETVTAIKYRVFDKDAGWRDVAIEVAAAADTSIDVEISYDHLDLADSEKCAAIDISGADLIIFSYLMSELCTLEISDVIALNLRNMLSRLKAGAAILFIDSLYPKFIEFFRSCRMFIGRQKNDDGAGVDLPLPSFLPTFKSYRDTFDRNPRMDASVVSKWLVVS